MKTIRRELQNSKRQPFGSFPTEGRKHKKLTLRGLTFYVFDLQLENLSKFCFFRVLQLPLSFRIDDELKKELAFIKSTLKSTQSKAIKDAIHAFYQYLLLHEKSKKSPQAIFKESGYLGSFKGKKNLSVNYRSALLTDELPDASLTTDNKS